MTAGLLGLAAALVAYIYIPRSLPPQPDSFMLIAHRGVSQTFPLENLENDTCTAKIIYLPTHRFLENTLPSMQAAFDYGADMVELDIHPTTDNQLAVFHDWTVDCRTNGKGITQEQSMAILKQLDIGYGYTADGGQTYPFRGQGVAMMPTLDEVLTAFPEQTFLIDQKDRFSQTIELLSHTLGQYSSHQQSNLYLFSGEEQYAQLKQEIPDVQRLFSSRREVKDCIPDYLKMLISGQLPDICSRYALGLPIRYLNYVPGWPGLFLSKARQAHLQVYVLEVDTLDSWEKIQHLPLDGIVTNRVEVIGPLLK
ncbi:glycerophosphodiester phosphodiesterase [Leptolyngbya cf. ectocarpi LEGE 11479]|uniref:Glycerophosphodiester phosphodiesterase n=1 Tax=Leptolyngbya cf. ectocarpi LEGE 11479 TaxID=1828722 RepID=A0A928ZZE8_LEPEC|nr:glycerophosphodiester phosphodiesterase family protein [Leptolyngbya ectocarpi]MBE9070241.1 glycerophosphodiester phosphodiesterase [Leptolyngbya cf. ectocarpi LEGE 11479]